MCLCKPVFRIERSRKLVCCRNHWLNGEKKKCWSTVFSVSGLLLCCVCARCSLRSTLCPLAFRETKIYVAFSSLPIYFYFTLELLQYRGDSPQVLKPSKISPLVEVKVPCLVCFQWRGSCFDWVLRGIPTTESYFWKAPSTTVTKKCSELAIDRKPLARGMIWSPSS